MARSTFPSQNVQNTRAADHFWRLRCRKSARRCGTKHISKSKCTKHLSVGPRLQVQMSKKCTPLWHEAHFQVKMYKTPQRRTTFGGSVSLRFASLHYITLHYTPLHYTPLHFTTLNYTTLHYIALHYTPLHFNYNYNYTTTLHYTPPHSTTLNYTALH